MERDGSEAARGGRRALARFVLLYATLYGGYGALSPFLPAYLGSRGVGPAEIATILGAAMLVRLVSGPFAGRLADRTGATAPILSAALNLTALFTFGFLIGHGFWTLLAVGLVQAVATAPLGPLADTLALAAARAGRFEYGWVRAAGSAAFIGATLLAGHLVGVFGFAAGIMASAAFFLLSAGVAARMPATEKDARDERPVWSGFLALAAIPRFRRIVLAGALVVGAHAMHDAFAVMLWVQAGIGTRTAALLWSESVASEILVFLVLGPWLLARIGPRRALALAALAGAVRWTVEAMTLALPALAVIQSLHGLTFALMHLACLALIRESAPSHLQATALTLYGSLGLGLATALVTFASGRLYATLGMSGFLAMSGLSLMAVPIALSLRDEPPR